jgi:hypothetical protein
MDWSGPGVIVSNGSYRFHNQVVPDGCTDEWAFSGAPPALVAVDLEPAVSGPVLPGTNHPDTPLPLFLRLARPAPQPAPSPGTRVREYVLPIWAQGVRQYDVHVWVGPQATPTDIALAQRVVATLRHSESPGDVSMCAVVMKAQYGGHVVSLGDCAALVGLRPLPEISLTTGERLTLLGPITNDRPTLPTSTNSAVFRLVETGTGTRLGVFEAEGPGTTKLVIEHPRRGLCVQQPANRCVVASVVVQAP